METPHAQSFSPATVGVNKKSHCTAVVVAWDGSPPGTVPEHRKRQSSPVRGQRFRSVPTSNRTLPSARKIKTVVP
jgi:hypothetical protein